jgi:polyphosphate glucokinase
MSTKDPAASTADNKPASLATSAAPAAATSKAIPLTGVALGIDVGGTGVKAAVVDLATAELVSPRIREKTPQPSEPAAVLETVASVVSQVLEAYGPVKDLAVGCGLPGAIKHGHMKTAANLDKGWIDYDATTEISAKLGSPAHVINDADAAGMAELAYGEAKDQRGTTILLTLGTGIGSALISEGRLVPNTEFGHLLMHDQASETLVSGVARERRGLKWKEWAVEFNEYLAMLEFFFWPDRIILGGGVSKRSDKYWKYLKTNADLVKAKYLNTSGIIGAAYAAGLAAHEAAETAKAGRSRRPAARRTPATKKRG